MINDQRDQDQVSSRLIINASNLHVGGGLQVAASFLMEISAWHAEVGNIAVLASSEVAANLLQLGCDITKFARFEIVNVWGLELFRSRADEIMDGYDAVLTVFGPLYRLRVPFKSVVGFAQPWIIYPQNECYRAMSLLNRWRTRFKYWVQGLFFRRADVLLVELEHVRDAVIRQLGIRPSQVHVAKNSLSSIYSDPGSWLPLHLPHADAELRLAFLGRNYPHKNTSILPAIAAKLKSAHGINAKFFVTFTDEEWRSCSAAFRDACLNVGVLTVAQCPKFYLSMDAVVFPSLLECFSATPLEAMAMGKPLFASDLPFNRDICQEHAHYFDPLSPESAADAIARIFANGGPDRDRLRSAREHALNFSSARARAEKYLSLLIQSAEEFRN